jgi:hypothetical protein
VYFIITNIEAPINTHFHKNEGFFSKERGLSTEKGRREACIFNKCLICSHPLDNLLNNRFIHSRFSRRLAFEACGIGGFLIQ